MGSAAMYNKPRNDTGKSFVGHPGRCQHLALHFGQLVVRFFPVFFFRHKGYFALVRIIRSSTRFYVCSFSRVIVFHRLVMCFWIYCGRPSGNPEGAQQVLQGCSRV